MDPVTPASPPVEPVRFVRQPPREPSRFVREAFDARSLQAADAVGSARPGDVIALPGGSAVVQDLNANGLVDGYDAVIRPRVPGPALRIDVHA